MTNHERENLENVARMLLDGRSPKAIEARLSVSREFINQVRRDLRKEGYKL